MLQIINLKLQAKSNMLLQYDYNYPLGCEIYKKIQLVDKEFGIKFHKEGLRVNKEDKPFKLMTMLFHFNSVVMDKKGIILNNNDIIDLEIRGTVDILNKVLNGFMIDNTININGNIFSCKKSELKSIPNLKYTNIFKIETILIESIQDENKKQIYLNAFDLKYGQAIKENLKKKYKLLYNKEYTGDLKIGIEDFLKVKQKTIKIKNYNIYGSGKFNIIIQGDKDIQNIAYCCGVGTHNTYGAGFLKYITGRRINE